MAARVYGHFLYHEFRIVSARDKQARLSKIRVFAHLRLNEFYGFPYLTQNGSFECNILYHIHLRPDLFVNTFVSNKTGAGTREELLWILAEQKNTGYAYVFLPIFICCQEIVVFAKIFERGFPISHQISVLGNGIHIYVIDGRPVHSGVFVETFSLVVHQLHALVKCQFAAFITDTHKRLVGLIGVQKHTCRNIHQKYTVGVAVLVGTRQVSATYRYRRIAEIERNPQQFVQFVGTLVYSFNPAGFVRYADGYLTAIRIGKRHDGHRQCLRIHLNAFAIKGLSLFTRLYVI